MFKLVRFYLFFLIYGILTSFNTLYSQEQKTFTLPDGINEGAFRFAYKNIFRRDLICKLYLDKVYIPYYDLMAYLQINQDIDYPVHKISGYYLKIENEYTIDFFNKTYSLKGINFQIDNNEILLDELEVYVLPSFFKKLFNWDMNLSFKELTIKLKNDDDLPIYQTYVREKQYNFLGKNKNYNEDDYFPLKFDRTRSLLSFGSIDYRLRGSIDNDNNRSFNYATNVGFEILGGDITVNTNGNYDITKRSNRLLNLARWRLNLGDNNYLRNISIGDLTTNSFRMSSLPSESFTGIQITNEKEFIADFFSNYIIEDKIEPGWQVELYKDGFLFAQAVTDPLGHYKFVLPVNYGKSSYELRFYGKKGEYQGKFVPIQIPPELMKPGEMKYFLNAGKSKLIMNKFMGEGRVSLGIFNWLSNSSSIQKVENINSLKFVNSMNIGLLDNLYLTHDFYLQEKNSLKLRYWPVNNGNYEISATKFDKLTMYNYNSADYNLYFNFNSQRLFNTSFNPSIMGNRYWFKDKIIDIVMIKGSYIVIPFLFDLSYNLNLTNNFINPIEPNGFISTQFSYFLMNRSKIFSNAKFTLSALYSQMYKKFTQMEFDYDQGLFQNTLLVLKFIKDFNNNNYSISANLRIDFNTFRSTTEYHTYSGKYHNLSEEIEGLIGIDSKQLNYTFGNPINRSSIGSSSASVKLYNDANMNNKFDNDEVLLTKVKIDIKSHRASRKQMGKETQFFNLLAYEQYNVVIDQSSIKNPLLIPQFTEFSFIAEPNLFKSIEVPCYSGGAVEGNVFLVKKDIKVGQAGVRVIITSKDLKFRTQVPVFSDGSFYKLGIPPGDYIAYVDSLQREILKVEQTEDFKEFSVKQTVNGDFVSGIDIELIPRAPFTRVLAKDALDPKQKDVSSKLTPALPKGYGITDSVGGELVRVADTNQALTVADTSGTGVNKDILGAVIVPSADTTAATPDLKTPQPLEQEIAVRTTEESKPAPPLKMTQTFAYSGPRVTYLTPPMQRELDKIAAYMQANSGAKLYVEGHTDVFGTLDEHTKVSEQRANEVLSYMVRKGIGKSRLFASGKGSLQPLADNATEAGRKKNRRVELRVITN